MGSIDAKYFFESPDELIEDIQNLMKVLEEDKNKKLIRKVYEDIIEEIIIYFIFFIKCSKRKS